MDLVNLLRNGGKAARKAIDYLRTGADVAEQADTLRHLDQYPSVKSRVVGNCVVKEWKDVWNISPPVSIRNSQKAINWFSVVFLHCQHDLRKHIDLRSVISNHVLKGQFDLAEAALDKHFLELGPSLWSLYWHFLITEEHGGSAARVSLLERFREGDIGKLIPYCAAYFSLGTDKSLPEEHYQNTYRETARESKSPISKFFELIFLDDISGDWKAWELLEYAERLPLVDRYEVFIQLGIIAFADRNSDSVKFGRAFSKLAAAVPDAQLQYAAEIVEPAKAISATSVTRTYFEAWDRYVLSQYQQCKKLCQAISSFDPALLGPHELYVRAAMYLREDDAFSGTQPVNQLLHHMRNVLSKNEQTEDSLAFLLRFSSRYRILCLSPALRAFHAQHSACYLEEKWHRRAAAAAQIHGPRNCEYGFSTAENQLYLERYVAVFPGESSRFFQALAVGNAIQNNPSFSHVPRIRIAFFEGIFAARKGVRDYALTSLTEFLRLQGADSSNPLSPFATEEARRVLVDLYRVAGNVVEMQRTLVLAYIERPQSVRRLPIEKIFAACLSRQADAERHAEFPIVSLLAGAEPHEISIYLRRYMRTINAKVPSDLKSAPIDNRIRAILYIRVCTLEVLDSLRTLNSVDKVEAERLMLLRWTIENSPPFSRSAESEVLRLTQHAQLRDALQMIEGARVILNVAALREQEQEKFSDAYFRFTAQKTLASAQAGELLSTLQQLRSSSTTSEALVSALQKTEAMRERQKAVRVAFAAAFRAIRDAFVSSPHFGIEACLSGRIRHGFVIQHIRKPLVERHLAVGATAAERKEIEDFWRERLHLQSGESLKPVIDVLHEMTSSVNVIAEEVKGTWIQSRTEHRNPEGLFDFSFADDELDIIYPRFAELANVESFIDAVVQMLLERTRFSLETVQKRIRTDLMTHLQAIIDDAVGDLLDLETTPPQYIPIRNELVASRHDSERICHELSSWFETSDATLMGDAPLELVAHTAVGMIERLNPEFRGRHTVNVETNDRIHGRYFTAFVHILFFLLDNAIRHTDLPKDRFSSNVSITKDPKTILVNVQNTMASPQSAREAVEKIQKKLDEFTHELDPAKVIREGGSGLAKITAALRYEFKKESKITAKAADTSVNLELNIDPFGLVLI